MPTVVTVKLPEIATPGLPVQSWLSRFHLMPHVSKDLIPYGGMAYTGGDGTRGSTIFATVGGRAGPVSGKRDGAMKQLVSFMNSQAGRLLRGALGVALIVIGLAGVHGTGGTVLAVIGLVPLAMGAWGRCLLEPFTAHRIA